MPMIVVVPIKSSLDWAVKLTSLPASLTIAFSRTTTAADWFLSECLLDAAWRQRTRWQEKTSVTVDELLSYELYVLERDLLEDFDAARDALEAKTPVPREVEFNFLDLEVFNRAQASDSVILNIPYWTEAHPLFRWIPIEWPLTARFGLIYTKTPSAGLKDFIDEATKETRT